MARIEGRDKETEVWEDQWEENVNSNWGEIPVSGVVFYAHFSSVFSLKLPFSGQPYLVGSKRIYATLFKISSINGITNHAGALQSIPIRVCFLLPLLPLLALWWQARLCLLEENFSRSLHSWRYFAGQEICDTVNHLASGWSSLFLVRWVSNCSRRECLGTKDIKMSGCFIDFLTFCC